ncbi:hypothetical protein MC60_001185 [Aeromonas caviae]|uniref:Uncharacterized protein n=1 Tax=Aeromonas caviae TaxID=648 RepID=A0A7U5YBA1_AERCA|nr:hypothetical protein MC60_001185 [Aeromonas caviae]
MSSQLIRGLKILVSELTFSPTHASNKPILAVYSPFQALSRFFVRSLPLTNHLVHPKQVG